MGSKTEGSLQSYEAVFKTVMPNGIASKGNVLFAARDRLDAVASFKRWYDGRQQKFPSVFGHFEWVQIAEFALKVVEDDGHIAEPADRPFYIWPQNFPGLPYGEGFAG